MSAYDTTPYEWSIDVHHATHDDVKSGDHAKYVSHVILSREYFPRYVDAEVIAAQMIATVHGTMPTRVMLRY